MQVVPEDPRDTPGHPADQMSAAGAAEQLSAFVDGEAAPHLATELCRRWRQAGGLQREWRAYHLIGEVMRSDDMAAAAPRDAAFMAALRQRLAAEPVPLVPAATLAAAPAPRRWLAPTAVAAAGVAAVAVALVVLRSPGETGLAPDQMAAVAVPSQPLAVAATGDLRQVDAAGPSASMPRLVVDGQVIRDARLDAYFEAHRGAMAGHPSAVPGAGVRDASHLMLQR